MVVVMKSVYLLEGWRLGFRAFRRSSGVEDEEFAARTPAPGYSGSDTTGIFQGFKISRFQPGYSSIDAIATRYSASIAMRRVLGSLDQDPYPNQFGLGFELRLWLGSGLGLGLS